MLKVVTLLVASAVVLETSFALGTSPSILCKPGDEGYLNANPLGTCMCEGHLYVTENCLEGFYCTTIEGTGCYIKCPDRTYLFTDFENEHWECVPFGEGFDLEAGEEVDVIHQEDGRALTRCVTGGYDVCPATGTPAPPPDPDTVTENPLGTCRCNGELWMSEGCSYGFVCDDAEDIGGFLKTCAEGEIVLVEFGSGKWSCSKDMNKCPGGLINGLGCRQPNCMFDHNTLGTCDCDGQIFINDECTEGFYCSSNIPDPYLYQGCSKKCLGGQALVPDLDNRDWNCVDKDQMENYKCPGAFNLECPNTDTDIGGGGFTDSDCGCDGELLVSSDCSEAYYCQDASLGGGRALKCKEGEVIEVDLNAFEWACVEDTGKCPGLGGFRVGCADGNEIVPPALECKFAQNPLGECECGGQIFVSEDCSESFYCSYFSPEKTDGCHKQCEEGEVVFLDIPNKEWECRERAEGFICPGKFEVDCPVRDGSFNVTCGCSGEVWMNSECNAAFLCEEENTGEEGKTNKGYYASCPPGRIIDIDFNNAFAYNCTREADKCPGSFHFGCKGREHPRTHHAHHSGLVEHDPGRKRAGHGRTHSFVPGQHSHHTRFLLCHGMRMMSLPQ